MQRQRRRAPASDSLFEESILNIWHNWLELVLIFSFRTADWLLIHRWRIIGAGSNQFQSRPSARDAQNPPGHPPPGKLNVIKGLLTWPQPENENRLTRQRSDVIQYLPLCVFVRLFHTQTHTHTHSCSLRAAKSHSIAEEGEKWHWLCVSLNQYFRSDESAASISCNLSLFLFLSLSVLSLSLSLSLPAAVYLERVPRNNRTYKSPGNRRFAFVAAPSNFLFLLLSFLFFFLFFLFLFYFSFRSLFLPLLFPFLYVRTLPRQTFRLAVRSSRVVHLKLLVFLFKRNRDQ